MVCAANAGSGAHTSDVDTTAATDLAQVIRAGLSLLLQFFFLAVAIFMLPLVSRRRSPPRGSRSARCRPEPELRRTTFAQRRIRLPQEPKALDSAVEEHRCTSANFLRAWGQGYAQAQESAPAASTFAGHPDRQAPSARTRASALYCPVAQATSQCISVRFFLTPALAFGRLPSQLSGETRPARIAKRTSPDRLSMSSLLISRAR